jgi:MFS family permease
VGRKKTTTSTDAKKPSSRLKDIIFDKDLSIIGIALLATGIGSTLVGNFMIVYLHDSFGLAVTTAGLISGLSPFAGMVSSALIGRIYDTFGNFRTLIVAAGAATALSLAVNVIHSVSAAMFSTILVGFWSSAGFTLSIIGARTQRRRNPDPTSESMAIGWVVSFTIFSSFIGPPLFTYFVSSVNYATAWMFSGILSSAFVISVLVAYTARASRSMRA